ncbi:MAG: helix-turn-helix domain-containing protein [Spartobacteria bacterium]|nr:helix-turn-helix domain-containing protein [Spartobacteria bacterium]
MKLTVQDAAELLNVSDKTVYRWVKNGQVPAYKINDQIRFNRAELLEWATARRINVSAGLFEEEEGDAGNHMVTGLYDALLAGGIFYRVVGADVSSVLQSVVRVMPMPAEVDREFLHQVLLARESMGSTCVGDGIAIPHPRNPVIMHIERPTISLCFLENPVPFGSMDGKPVHSLFTLVSPVTRVHLNLISRIAYALQQPEFKKLIATAALRDDILKAAKGIDAKIDATKAKQ